MKILMSVAVAALLFVGCSDDSKSSASKVESVHDNAPKQIEKKVETKVEVPAENVIPKDVSVKEEPKAVTAVITGDTIFRACAACHGLNAEKAALGKSQIIKGWPADKVANALSGYKDGTYGGAMKGIMKGQASALSADDIKLVSEYISKL